VLRSLLPMVFAAGISGGVALYPKLFSNRPT
jgi:hypothetical protein